MFRRLPPDAFAYYLGLGVTRSYQAVADHFDVTKTAVANLAEREGWPERLRKAEQRVAEAAAKKAEETLAEMDLRHLRSLRAIQGKALEALRDRTLDSAMDAVRALELAIRQERVIRGEPGERAAFEVGDVIQREYERWLGPPESPDRVNDDSPPSAPSGVAASESPSAPGETPPCQRSD